MSKTKVKVGAAQPSDVAALDERTVNGYVAENAEKWNRAVEGSIAREGTLVGGVGKDASPEAKLAAYDRLGGLITKDGRKVKTGSFYDFKKQAQREVPEVVLILNNLEGDVVEIPEGEEIPLEVRAAEMAGAKKAEKNVAKATKSTKKAKASIEDEE